MKNEFCDLDQDDIKKLPDRFQGYLLSMFYKERGFVYVPETTFKEMIDLIAEAAILERDKLQHETSDNIP